MSDLELNAPLQRENTHTHKFIYLTAVYNYLHFCMCHIGLQQMVSYKVRESQKLNKMRCLLT